MTSRATHLKIVGIDCRESGQTEYEYSHQAACGWVRENVTRNINEVNCFYCKHKMKRGVTSDRTFDRFGNIK